MNPTYIIFAHETGTPEYITKELNHIKQYCSNIHIINCTFGLNQLHQPILIILMKLDIKSDVSLKDYQSYKANKKNIN
jgi:hypothetical protein